MLSWASFRPCTPNDGAKLSANDKPSPWGASRGRGLKCLHLGMMVLMCRSQALHKQKKQPKIEKWLEFATLSPVSLRPRLKVRLANARNRLASTWSSSRRSRAIRVASDGFLYGGAEVEPIQVGNSERPRIGIPDFPASHLSRRRCDEAGSKPIGGRVERVNQWGWAARVVYLYNVLELPNA